MVGAKQSRKSKSKRMTLKQKYKVKKKVMEHHRKKRKEERKQGGKRKVPKDPGLPSQWPFKQELVKEFAYERQRILLQEKEKRDERKRVREEKQAGAEAMDQDGAAQRGLAAMRTSADDKASAFDARKRARGDASAAAGGSHDADSTRRAFFRDFKALVGAADVVLCVLDARDPEGTRCRAVERYVRSQGADKRVVLLLNKMDLVPREAGAAWLKYLRQELPTVAFKASTQQQGERLGQRAMPSAAKKAAKSAAKTAAKTAAGAAAGATTGGGSAAAGASVCLGADTLLQLLKNYARNSGLKTALTVGVVGLPNVGKSSLINSLKRARVAQVGNTPGVTRTLQEVHLDKHIKLLDSPGIVFSDAESGAAAALRNALKVERLADPLLPVSEVLRRVPPKQLMALYKIGAFEGADQFLQRVADARGKLRKGGTPDVAAAARIVLQDWNDGRIPFYTMPPTRGDGAHEEARLVETWGAEFDADSVFADEARAVLPQLPSLEDEGAAFIEAAGAGEAAIALESMALDEDGDAEGTDPGASDMDDGEGHAARPTTAAGGAAATAAAAGSAREGAVLYSEEGQYNPRAARAERKRRKTAAATAAVEAEAAISEDFDFDEANTREGLPAAGDEGQEGEEAEEGGSGREEYGAGGGEGEGSDGEAQDADARYMDEMDA